MKIFITILMFFIIGALFIIGNNSLSLHDPENISNFYNFYLEWLNEIYINTQTITGEIVKQNWLP